MKKMTVVGAAVLAAGSVFAGLYGDTPDAKHAWAVHDWNRPKPHKVEPAAQPGNPPSDAVVLFDGTKASLERNWSDSKGQPTQWRFSEEGYFYCVPGWKNGGEIRTRDEFGDCHAWSACPIYFLATAFAGVKPAEPFSGPSASRRTPPGLDVSGRRFPRRRASSAWISSLRREGMRERFRFRKDFPGRMNSWVGHWTCIRGRTN